MGRVGGGKGVLVTNDISVKYVEERKHISRTLLSQCRSKQEKLLKLLQFR